MRFSRHAKNEMRLYGIRIGDVASVVWNPMSASLDQRGNRRLTGTGRDGHRAIIVVVAGDDSGFVITTFPDD